MKTSDPIFFALAQIRFNEINYEKVISSLKENFRQLGYIDLKEIEQRQIDININNGIPVPTETKTKVLTATDLSGYEGFIFNNRSLTIHTTSYVCFDKLLSALLNAIEILKEQVVLIERLGFRTLNAFKEIDKKLSAQIQPQFLGMYGEQNNFQHNYNESLCVSNNINTLSRVIIQNSVIAFPPDVQGDILKTPDVLDNLPCLHAMVDIDSSWSGREKYDYAFLKQVFENIHDDLKLKLNNVVVEKL